MIPSVVKPSAITTPLLSTMVLSCSSSFVDPKTTRKVPFMLMSLCPVHGDRVAKDRFIWSQVFLLTRVMATPVSRMKVTGCPRIEAVIQQADTGETGRTKVGAVFALGLTP